MLKLNHIFSLLTSILLIIFIFPYPAQPKGMDVKIATVTPEGSTWTNILNQFAKDVGKQTHGRVNVKIYAGGVSGDELDVLRKMQVNRIHATGFSGVGLGLILPEIRILEAPLLFNNTDEIDTVKEALYDVFSNGFAKKGYVLLGFVEAGFVYFYSQSDPSGPGGLSSVKMWVWKGDKVASNFLETFGIRTTPLHVTDVNTGLETGMINAFYSPPLAAVAFQWYSRIQYMLNYPMVNSSGAFLMTKRSFGRLSPGDQNLFKTLAARYCRQLVVQTRKDNAEAIKVLKASGINLVPPTAPQVEEFKANAKKTYEKNIPDLYSRQRFDSVKKILSDIRSKQ